MKTTVKWGLAIAFSLAAHAGAAAYLSAVEPEEAQVAGGEPMEVALLGNAFEDAIQAGEISETVTPEEVAPDEVAALSPDLQSEPIVAPAEPTPVVPEVTPEVSDVVPEEITPPVAADVVLPADAEPPVTADDPLVTASLQPAEELMPEIEDVVTPMPRPEPEKVVEKPTPKAPEKKRIEKKEPPRKVVERRQAGDDGKAAETKKRGVADGQNQAKAADVGGGQRGQRQQAAGNAAVSNYPGKVRARLTRALRYPPGAARGGIKGDAQVRFTVRADGQVASISLARSTGSPILDEAALAAVRRAAPFPKIPEGAGRDSWAFTIPLGFHR
ncbi:protein TonB [Rhizobium sp. RU20A]|uniref:TonB family protein n=1 Tax=Rhizobium sp. RU20A TaxID=1907412 RepID=UPI000955FB5A|nr:TonB family protein [Rhizobium sp. RU20A]SIQ30794.1 protein TonB [Rhizobium sp. RU20A]